VTATQEVGTAAPASTVTARTTRVAVVAGRSKMGVLLDANAAVSVQLSALLDLANTRLSELGEPTLTPDTDEKGKPIRGRWALCQIDGTPLKAARSLADQGVTDGTRLWLRFVPDTEARIDVVEQVTTAMAGELAKRWSDVTPVWAGRVGVSMVSSGVLAATAFMGQWRYGHPGWLVVAFCLGLAVAVVVTAVVVLNHARTRPARQIGDVLLLIGIAPAALGIAAAIPGAVGAPHVALGLAGVIAAALLIVRFTGRYIALGTAVLVTGAAGAVLALLRMSLVTSAVVLLTGLLLVAVLGVHVAPTVARWACGIRLPVFPSASGRWIFEARPELPAAVVVASGDVASLDGPESVRDVAVHTDRAHGYLTGLLVGTTALVVACCVGLCDPTAPRRWLPLVVSGLVAVALLLRGRAYTDRWQATILAVAAVAVPIGVAGRYVAELETPLSLLIGAAVMVVVPVAGLVAAVVVPNRFYTPPFRKIIEWVEYLCLVGIFPLTFWVMDVFAAIRYR
jgi:type VII secretion integral membrane protein EccD